MEDGRKCNIFSVLCFIISREVKIQLKHTKKTCAVYGEGAVTDQMFQSGLQSLLILLTFWTNNSLLWGHLMHWKIFSSAPGLYPLEGNSGR